MVIKHLLTLFYKIIGFNLCVDKILVPNAENKMTEDVNRCGCMTRRILLKFYVTVENWINIFIYVESSRGSIL